MAALDAAAAADEALSTVWRFATYVIAALLYGFALCVNVYVLAALDDLQADFVNPHDASRRINRLVNHEIAAHACASALMLCGGHYALFAANAPMMYWEHARREARTLRIDATEIFARAEGERKIRTRKLAFLGVVELIVAYRVTHSAAHALLTKAGREAAAKILRDAAHSPMYHMF